jgi:hypothetical protein
MKTIKMLLSLLLIAAPAYAQFSSGGAGGGSVDLTSTASNVVPSADNTYDVGSTTARWQDVYLISLKAVDDNVRLSYGDAASIAVQGDVVDGATAVGVRIGNVANLITAGGKIAQFCSGAVTTGTCTNERAWVDVDGSFATDGFLTTATSARLALRGQASNAAAAEAVASANSAALSALDDRNVHAFYRGANLANKVAQVTAAGAFVSEPNALTIADNAVGASAAASTSTPIGNSYRVTCNDADGCNLTLGETSAKNGVKVTVINVGTNTVNFADTAGVSETAGAFAAGQYDNITFEYVTDRWVEIARVNN